MQAKKREVPQQTAAAKAGFSTRTARRIDRHEHCSFKEKPKRKSTRKDPFEEVWSPVLVPLLEREPSLQAVTLLRMLQRRYPGSYPDELLRTLQRRVQAWKATDGPPREVIFRQVHPPGFEGSSDFTHANRLNVTINGLPFIHMFYHFRLSYSSWEYAQIVQGGESFTALSEGLQNALERLGGAPLNHRTDSLSAAYKNLSTKEKEDLTQACKELYQHYHMKPTRNNKGVAHENGGIESSHGHLKTQLEQALLLRGDRDFPSIEAYEQFVNETIEEANQRRKTKVEEERQFLQPLPDCRARDYAEKRVRVTSSSTITLFGVIYSVPSRLIGSLLYVQAYDDRLKCFVGNTEVLSLKRLRKGQSAAIDYRHFIHSLERKPGAFRHFVFREQLFPSPTFRQAWEALDQQLEDRKACREYVRILKWSARNESFVTSYLQGCLLGGRLPQSGELEAQFVPQLHPKVEVRTTELSLYNGLLGGRP